MLTESNSTDGITESLMDSDSVSMVTSYVLAYEYINPSGNVGYGFQALKEQTVPKTRMLGVLADKWSNTIMDEWLDDGE